MSSIRKDGGSTLATRKKLRREMIASYKEALVLEGEIRWVQVRGDQISRLL